MEEVFERDVRTFRFNEKYLVDIVETSETYEAWLFRENCGVKDFMYGVLRTSYTYGQFLLMVDSSLSYDSYIDFYEEEYGYES